MPRELITLQVGQCGNQIGCKFWDLALHEHAANNAQATFQPSMSTFFRNVDAGGRDVGMPTGTAPIQFLKARALLVDMEQGVLDQVMKGHIGELFDGRQLISDVSGAGNNWARGFCHYGPKYHDTIMEKVRHAVEQCDSLQCFMLIHSLGGGTGSGVGTYVLQHLQDEFPNVYRFVTPVFPSEDDDVVTSPYNSILSLAQLIDHADCVLPLCNDALSEICAKVSTEEDKCRRSFSASAAQKSAGPQEVGKPWERMNMLAAQLLLDLTCSMRFEGPLNVDLNEVTMNMVPYPRMHFLISSLTGSIMNLRDTPAGGQPASHYYLRNMSQLFSDAFSRDYQLITADPKQDLYLASALLLRGDVDMADIRQNLARVQRGLRFVRWNPEGWKVGHCAVPPLNQPRSLLCIANNCCIADTFTELRARFMRLYKYQTSVVERGHAERR
eukprot:TRINITY_DN816_c0_g1_i6.p1 TRINITY_DN816_c0_g1~~TRINITY_DN816_c0_g1_i6.p1  ORF type:complete len:450 (+),score=118.80 TRINITY_DN816_c0_g1_i6:28-1350(+)